MSSEIIDQNFNSKIEQVEEKTDGIQVEEQCDLNKSSSEHTQSDVDKEEITKNPKNSLSITCDSPSGSGQFEALNMDQNLNAPKRFPQPEWSKQEIGIENCDSCSIVENISNAITEKENIKNLNNRLSNSSSHTKIEKNAVTSADKLIRDTLIHKVTELEISGKANIQNNVSAVVLKKETESLKNLLFYDISSDDDDDDFEKNWQLLSVADAVSDSESDSSDSIESSSDSDTDDVSSDIIFGQKDKGAIKKDTSKVGNSAKTPGDFSIRDLPPVPDLSNLNINYEKEEFLHMGHVQAVIDTLVTVEAIPGTPAYDLDSYLFIEDKTTKRPLGVVYDVIGPVTAPIYCIRFNTNKDIQDLNIKQGLKVFSAPKSDYTHYVFLKELMKNKGSDASWVGDTELPPEVAAEMSDEEDERNFQNARKAQKRKHGSLERHKQFEKSMNRCNTLNTRVAQLVDAHRRLPRPIRYNEQPQRVLMNDFSSISSRLPAPFDPTVPPPGFHYHPRENNMSYSRPPMQWGWVPHDMYPPSVRPPNTPPFMQRQNNSANYYTNNAGRNHAAGPSTQP